MPKTSKRKGGKKVGRKRYKYYGVCARDDLSKPLIYLFKLGKQRDAYLLIGYVQLNDKNVLVPHFKRYIKIDFKSFDDVASMIKTKFTDSIDRINKCEKFGKHGWIWYSGKCTYFAYINKNDYLVVKNLTKRTKASIKMDLFKVAFIIDKLVKNKKDKKSAYMLEDDLISFTLKPFYKWFFLVEKGRVPLENLKQNMETFLY